MSRAGMKAKSARARATIAAAIYKARKPDGYGHTDFGRALDGCFESGDGYAVGAWMIHRAITGDHGLIDAVLAHHPGDEGWWLKRACAAWKRGDVATVRAVFDKQCEGSREGDSPGTCGGVPVLPKWPFPEVVESSLFVGGAA